MVPVGRRTAGGGSAPRRQLAHGGVRAELSRHVARGNASPTARRSAAIDSDASRIQSPRNSEAPAPAVWVVPALWTVAECCRRLITFVSFRGPGVRSAASLGGLGKRRRSGRPCLSNPMPEGTRMTQ